MISIYPNPGIHTRVNYPFQPVDIRRFSLIANYITRYTWSPIIFNNMLRQERHFSTSRLIGLDFDNKDEQVMTLSQAVDNVFAGMRHIIGTTKSHQKPKVSGDAVFPPADRFRVILMLAEPVKSMEDYQYTFAKSIEYYGSDSDAAGASRLFHPCREIVSISDGFFEDFYQQSLEDKIRRQAMADIRAKEAAAYRELGIEPPYIKRILQRTVSSGRNPALYPAIRYYAELGMDILQIEEIIKTSNTYIHNSNDRQWVKGIVSSIRSAVKNHGVGNG